PIVELLVDVPDRRDAEGCLEFSALTVVHRRATAEVGCRDGGHPDLDALLVAGQDPVRGIGTNEESARTPVPDDDLRGLTLEGDRDAGERPVGTSAVDGQRELRR